MKLKRQKYYHINSEDLLTLVLLNLDIPCLCKQCRSRSVGFWRSQLIWIYTLPFSIWIYYMNNLDQVIWLAENLKWAWLHNLFSMTRVKKQYMYLVIVCLFYLGFTSRWCLDVAGRSMLILECCLIEMSNPKHMTWYSTQSIYTDMGLTSSDS